MNSKATIFFCLMALVFLIATEVTAKDLPAEKTEYPAGAEYVADSAANAGGDQVRCFNGNVCRFSCCSRCRYVRGCARCCSSAAEALLGAVTP